MGDDDLRFGDVAPPENTGSSDLLSRAIEAAIKLIVLGAIVFIGGRMFWEMLF